MYKIKNKNEDQNVIWSNLPQKFKPKFDILPERDCVIHEIITRNSSKLDVFKKLFTYSFLLTIVENTNKRIKIYENKKKVKKLPTDVGEITIVLAINFVMCFNKLPKLKTIGQAKNVWVMNL